jgi:hypothetical protein
MILGVVLDGIAITFGLMTCYSVGWHVVDRLFEQLASARSRREPSTSYWDQPKPQNPKPRRRQPSRSEMARRRKADALRRVGYAGGSRPKNSPVPVSRLFISAQDARRQLGLDTQDDYWYQ